MVEVFRSCVGPCVGDGEGDGVGDGSYLERILVCSQCSCF